MKNFKLKSSQINRLNGGDLLSDFKRRNDQLKSLTEMEHRIDLPEFADIYNTYLHDMEKLAIDLLKLLGFYMYDTTYGNYHVYDCRTGEMVGLDPEYENIKGCKSFDISNDDKIKKVDYCLSTKLAILYIASFFDIELSLELTKHN